MEADRWVVAFLRDGERRHLSPNTIEDRRRLLNRFVREINPETPLTVAQAHIEDWLDTCKIGPRSRYSYISTFAAFFDYLEETGQREDNPVRRIRRPKLGRLLPRPISDADLEYALSVADLRMRAWLCLAGFQGLRCAEIANLRREDLLDDRDPPLLVVRQGKGAKDAILPLNPRAEEALRSYGLRSGYLFLLNNGERLGARTLSCYVGRFLRGHGIKASAHRARHTFGTAVYRLSGGDLRLTQEMLRHSDPKTSAIYADYDQAKAAAVVRQLGSREGRTAGATYGSRAGSGEHGDDPADAPEGAVEFEADAHFGDHLPGLG